MYDIYHTTTSLPAINFIKDYNLLTPLKPPYVATRTSGDAYPDQQKFILNFI